MNEMRGPVAMAGEENWDAVAVAPAAAVKTERQDEWSRSSNFEESMSNGVSFGFVATAILISMFLVMAIFEWFLRPTQSDPSSHLHQTHTLFHFPSPKITRYSEGVSVLMPGEETPTFIAHPVPPPPCPPDRILCPLH